MSDYVNDALLGASPYKKQADEAKALVSKWDKTGLLDGLNEDFKRSGMATMLENQAKQLISENSGTGGTAGGSTNGASSEEWSGVALPLVRRIFGEIAAQDFVSVQPMNLPSGLVFYLDFKYGKTTAGSEAEGFGASSATGFAVPGGSVKSIGGKTGPSSPGGQGDQVAPFGVGGLYGEGRYDYSINGALSDELTLDGTTDDDKYKTGSVSYKDINFNQEFSSSLSTFKKITVGTGDLSALDKKAVRSFNISGSTGFSVTNASQIKVLPQFTSHDETNDEISFVVSGSVAGLASIVAANKIKVIYSKQPTESDRGDFEDTAGNATADTLAIPEVDLQLQSSAIVAKTRKLKAVWSPELAQDLNAYHSVDAEAELTSMLSEYISMEIDLEILDMLIADATTTDYWSAKVGKYYDSASSSFSSNTDGLAYTKFEWYQTLVEKIQKVSNTIHQLTLRGGANFVVVSPKVATILESIPGYAASTDGNKAQFAMGVSQVGSVAGRFTVYKNPYMTENVILVGFRGSNFLETGAVYAPYVPMIMTPLVYDPKNFTPRKGVMTRYAKKMVRPEFYGKVVVADVNYV